MKELFKGKPLQVVEKVKFEQVYMFIYSRRVGTPGDRMENQIPEEEKHVRFASVYREFKDVNTFMAEIKKILEK